MDATRLERVLDDDYAGDVGSLSMDELRSRRAECQELEVGVSFLRRMAQGRLDIVAAERQRRTSGGEPLDHDHLVEQLTGILAERTRAPGFGRLPQLMAPSEAEGDTSELDAIAGPGVLGGLADIDDAELDRLVQELAAYEHDVSARRRALHERIDAFQAEITRRYRTGEATVESLLQ